MIGHVFFSNVQEMTAERNVHIITGANMSGKSTYIRQVFLLQIMAQVGVWSSGLH